MVKKSNLNFKKEQSLTMLVPIVYHDAIYRHGKLRWNALLKLVF